MATNKVLQYAIKAMLLEGKSNSEIAEITNLSEKTIKKYAKVFAGSNSDEKEESIEKTKKKRTQLFINRTAAKKNKGVSIMTSEESGRGENVRQRLVPKKRQDIPIHRINDEE